MEIIGEFFQLIIKFFQIPITVYGFTFSFWDVFLFTIVVSIIAYFIGGVLYD